MRLVIDHRSKYRFSKPQARIVQLLRMTPSHSAMQSVVDWRINVDCDARLKAGRDGFGNCTTMLYIDGPVEAIELSVSGEVFTEPNEGLIDGADEPLPPPLFCRPTPLTLADDALLDFARNHAAGVGAVEQATALASAVADRTTRTTGLPDPARLATDTFAGRSGTARDLAHLLIAAARAIGLPARYISGHCFSGEREHARSAHSWAEVHVGPHGWLSLDPSTGGATDESYARVAIGLDASFAMPVSGTRIGGGREVLDVDVQVGQRDGEEPGQ